MNVFCGVDIGGTSVKLALIDENESILRTGSFPTRSELGSDAFLNTLARAIQSIMANSNPCWQLTAIGIGCTGPVDISTGIVYNPYTLSGLEGMSLTREVQERFQLPVYLENDSNTAHLGAVALSDKSPVSGNTLLITVGTGIGCSIRMDGELFRVPGGIHPEIGHIPTGVSSDIVCYCGKNNCMENIFSGTAINRDCKRLFDQTPEQVMKAFGDPGKMAYRESLISALTNAITEMVGIFHCEQVFISGGMKEFFAKYLIPETQKRLDQLKPIFGGTAILMPESDVLFGGLGAALLAKNQYQEGKIAPIA